MHENLKSKVKKSYENNRRTLNFINSNYGNYAHVAKDISLCLEIGARISDISDLQFRSD
ncbi:MAG TPA: hypothetical protein VF220_10145 [Nitrososphaeraceae archaeon]